MWYFFLHSTAVQNKHFFLAHPHRCVNIRCATPQGKITVTVPPAQTVTVFAPLLTKIFSFRKKEFCSPHRAALDSVIIINLTDGVIFPLYFLLHLGALNYSAPFFKGYTNASIFMESEIGRRGRYESTE